LIPAELTTTLRPFFPLFDWADLTSILVKTIPVGCSLSQIGIDSLKFTSGVGYLFEIN